MSGTYYLSIYERLRLSAAHELGHIAGFRTAGLTITGARVRASEAWVRLDDGEVDAAMRGKASSRAYLVGIAAGRSAQIRIAEQEDLPVCDYGWSDDFAKLRERRNQLPTAWRVPDYRLMADADALVRFRWTWITQNMQKIIRTTRDPLL